MQDLLAKGAAWFEGQRREHLAVNVSYQSQSETTPRTCRATLVIGMWEQMDSSGQLIRVETRDFYVHVDDLPIIPKRGDVVTMSDGGVDRTYEVTIPGGANAPWRWSDRLQTIRRIHTMQTASVATAFLARAVGSSSSSSLTDDQIKSLLTIDTATTRVLSRPVACASAYVYVVLPTAYGTPTFTVNGYLNSAWQTTTRSITFDGQAAASYTIYRSTYAVSGTLLLGVS
jgi:hypothetical protein